MKSDVKFSWGTTQQKSFSPLKNLLTSGPVLGYFQPNTKTKIHFDANGYGIGSILEQVQHGKERPKPMHPDI